MTSPMTSHTKTTPRSATAAAGWPPPSIMMIEASGSLQPMPTVMLWSQLIFSALHDERGRADAGAHFPESVGIDLVAEAGVGDGGKGGFVSPPDAVLDCLWSSGDSVKATAMKSSGLTISASCCVRPRVDQERTQRPTPHPDARE
jgi:hypothetical protein